MSDLIDRQAAIDITTFECGKWKGLAKEIAKQINALPSAEPERKKGKWIEYIPEHGKCPFCGNLVDLMNGNANNFCSECGADLRGGEQ